MNHTQFKTLINDSTRYFNADIHTKRVIFTLKVPLQGENHNYMKLKIAISRVLPFWETILLDNNGSQIILSYETKALVETSREILIKFSQEKKSIF